MRYLPNLDDFVFDLSGETTHQVDATSDGTEQVTLNITSTKRGESIGFSVDNSLDWVSVTTGESTLVYQVSENAGESERSGNVTLTQLESGKKITISFSQEMAPQYVFNISGETTQSLPLEAETSSGTMNVTSTKNGNLLGYTISGTPGWMSVNRSEENNALSYTSETNNTSSQRDAQIVLVQDETSSRITISVNQDFEVIETKAEQIVLWDSEASQKIVVDSETYDTATYPTSRYTPIGVVVIPASHMDDGKARMMSTRWMSCDDPENGSITGQGMYWGVYDVDINDTTNYSQLPIITSATGQQVVLASSNGFLPSDYQSYHGDSNQYDRTTNWYYEFGSANNMIPSPYYFNGTPDPNYRATSYSGGSINNALSYFDGKHQTDAIIATRGNKDYETWKPGSTKTEDYPAASVCDMYHTVGTNQGDWYLPSCGELGYVIARLNVLNETLNKIEGLQDLAHTILWSSTEHSATGARYVSTITGSVNFVEKDIRDYEVLAFTTL